MKATLPCYKPHQLSLFSTEHPAPGRHIWKDGVCIDCGVKKENSFVQVCDCGCKTPITKDTDTTHYGKLIFVFGHETLNLFGDTPIMVAAPKVKEPKKEKKQKKSVKKKAVSKKPDKKVVVFSKKVAKKKIAVKKAPHGKAVPAKVLAKKAATKKVAAKKIVTKKSSVKKAPAAHSTVNKLPKVKKRAVKGAKKARAKAGKA